MSNMLGLAIKAKLPIIHVTTDDVVNVAEVLGHYAGREIRYLNVPTIIQDPQELKKVEYDLYYTFAECKSLIHLYPWCQAEGVTIIFVNVDKSELMFDGGPLVAPRELVEARLSEFVDPEEVAPLLQSVGGMSLKDVVEVSMLTCARDSGLTGRGINRTRRGYISQLRGIQQIDTDTAFYRVPPYLDDWMTKNEKFFLNPVSASLVPRGLLFDGPPGTGKTMGAKYIADRFGLPLYHLDMSAMRGRYVGDSEGNLIAALQQVDQVEPCVVLLDEVEKVFQSQSDSGVSSSMLSQMLWWLQEHRTKVFVVMTTNDKSKIPPELFREGRIDETLMFAGLEGVSEAVEFAKQCYDTLAKDLFVPEPSDYDHLAKEVKRIMGHQSALAQVKVSQLVKDLVKVTLIQMEEGE